MRGTDMRWVGLRRFFTRRAALVATPVVLCLAGGGVAAAAVVSQTPTVINACAKRDNGALRLSKNCHHDEIPISWNQTDRRVLRALRASPDRKASPGPRAP